MRGAINAAQKDVRQSVTSMTELSGSNLSV